GEVRDGDVNRLAPAHGHRQRAVGPTAGRVIVEGQLVALGVEDAQEGVHRVAVGGGVRPDQQVAGVRGDDLEHVHVGGADRDAGAGVVGVGVGADGAGEDVGDAVEGHGAGDDAVGVGVGQLHAQAVVAGGLA